MLRKQSPEDSVSMMLVTAAGSSAPANQTSQILHTNVPVEFLVPSEVSFVEDSGGSAGQLQQGTPVSLRC